ncbi:MAG: hypothetical protein KDH09_03325 [Chrysiogenetes bacterium]|nr:hypothetical protein [Chrysiogenetes bacterium]
MNLWHQIVWDACFERWVFGEPMPEWVWVQFDLDKALRTFIYGAIN